MAFIHPLLFAENVFFSQRRQHCVRQDGEKLICDPGNQEGYAQCFQRIPKPVCQPVGMLRDFQVQPVLHENLKLKPQQAALGKHAALVLDHIPEVPVDGRIPDDHRFAKQSAHLGAADVKHIAQPGYIRKGQVIALCCQCVAQPGAVQEQVQPQFPADPGQFFQLPAAVQGPQFRRLGNIHHCRLHHVFKAGIIPVGQHRVAHLLPGDLSLVGGKRQALVSGALHGPRLMAVNVGGGGAEHPLVGPQRGGNHGKVGLGSTHQKVNPQILPAAGSADLLRRPGAEVVLPIPGGLDVVCFYQSLQYFLMAALAVIVIEVKHG